MVAKESSLESENASLEPDKTSLSEDASSKSEDAFLKSESKSDDTLSYTGLDRTQFQGEATDDENFALNRKVTVDFIHRTARDFMRDAAQGGAFLEGNTPSGFHPRVSFVKVLLAKLRLFGCNNSTRDPNATIHDIMMYIRLAEDETEVAQTQLCNLTDDVISRIDRVCGPWPTNTHWSVHWADRPSNWRRMHKDLLFPKSKSSSPSSSDDSFHSVNSQPDTPDEMTTTLIKRPDFLAFATFYGLHRYVQQVLHDRKEPLESDTASYLLYCAVHSRSPWQPPYLIQDFLRQAGDPNLKDPCSKMTTWSAFLVRMKWLETGGEDLRRAYMDTTVVFVEKGANLHSIFKRSNDGSFDYLDREYSLNIDLTPLAAIEMFFKDLPGYSYLGKLCANKGAPYYSRCTQVTIFDPQRRNYEVSDSESTGILEIYKRTFPNRLTKDHMEIATYLKRLFQDRLEDVSEPDSL